MQSLTIDQFDALCEDERLAVLDEQGVYLDAYRYSKYYKLALFQLWGFYCEVWLHRKTDKIIQVNAFSSYKRLDMYLDQVDINPIYSLL